MNKKLYMYATLPRKGHVPFGGGEVGNMRTIRMLQDAGYEIVTIRQRTAEASWGLIMLYLTYPFRMIAGWGDTFFKLIFASRKSLVHLSGFAGSTIFNEYILMHIMKMLGYRVVYELRGGGTVGFWENGSAFYKQMFRYLIDKACYVFSQGQENIPLIRSLTETPVYHYANCVEEDFAPKQMPEKPTDRVNLLFYGRIEESKHVDMIVEVAAMVQKVVPHVYLTVVGNGKADYIEHVKNTMQSMLNPGTFTCAPGCKHEELLSLLSDKHFYIFPSTQPREGQSNSVTECMAYGIVPIASPQGFNRSTIGDNKLIIDELKAESYAKRVVEIIQANKYHHYSRMMYERFQNNFTQKVVFERTLNVYREILEDENK